MRFRGKSIRRKIVALLLVPLVSLTGLWGFATFLTGREAARLLEVGYIVEEVARPLEDAVRVIQEERRQSLVYLADPRASDALPSLRRDRAATDRAIAGIRADARNPDVVDALQPQAARRLTSLLEALDGLSALRRSVEERTIGRIQALDFYNRLVDPCHTFLTHLHTIENVELDKQGRALVGIARAREMLSREDALVFSSLVSGRITAEEIRTVSGLVADRKLFYDVNLELLPSADREAFERYWRSPDTEPLREAENALVTAGATDRPRTTDAARWQKLATPVLDDLAAENAEAGGRYRERVDPAASGVMLKAGVAGVLGFLALLVSIVVSVRIGRGLVRDLGRLRKEAQEASGVRLPSVMRRLAAGEHVDVETEVPRLEYEKDEVGQVGQALNTLQRAAVEAAVKQADMRRGVSEVFVNLARRNQVLLHRQLTLLDTMERRTEDTGELADLFRLDHLTTRMRRHAEGLVILSGASPSRQWRRPVQLMDVVRAAVAEVEDYERIEVRRLPRIGVSGPAVADLTHLIAELLENAAVFSPPHTAVRVHGERVPNGFTLEIHDRGLGMTPEALLDANLRLAETPEFELSDTDRLGLFVVSRLARRQNVRVSLQPSPYGGTTAVVFLPAALLTDAPDTHGAGFRLDRQGAGRHRRDEIHGGTDRVRGDGEGHGGLPTRRPGLSGMPGSRPVPSGPAVPDGPVELEPPAGPPGREDAPAAPASAGAPEGARGGPRRPHGPLRPVDGPADGRSIPHEQHQQASDQPLARPVPLPRRRPRPPTLVADRGRPVDDGRPGDGGRAHPAAGTPRDPGTPRGGHEESGGHEEYGQSEQYGQPEQYGEYGEYGEYGRHARRAEAAPDRPAPPPDRPAPPLGGLPRRVRRPGPAPRPGERSVPPAAPAPGAGSAERDAEAVRDRMAAMQRGWLRGRRQNAAGAAPAVHADTPPGTTPEEDGR